jgi:archaellum component FlaG (FlaF/FlaG flagellin family)
VQFDESSVTRFESYSEDILNKKINNFTGPRNNINNALNRSGKVIGSIVARSQQITFAIWDDAVEDGDTISISINDKWITKNFPVLKKPQFITVTLEPGPNVITFVAENLGSIIPNTSVIEIIDGKKRKSFYIETDLDQNNLIKIFYDLKPE